MQVYIVWKEIHVQESERRTLSLPYPKFIDQKLNTLWLQTMKPLKENRRSVHDIVLGQKILDSISDDGQQIQN